MIDLRGKDRQAIITLAEAAFSPGTALWAYGSRVKGGNHEGSGLDLVVKTPQQQTLALERLANFKTALQASNIPILVQVLSWQHMPEAFKAGVLQNHEVLTVVGKEAMETICHD